MPTYHVELRNFPKTLTRFNQSGQQLGAIVLPWVENRILEMDDDKWAPWESTITILEGPPIPIGGLSMGRGWKTALREGSDVTDRVLDEARRAVADGSAYVPGPAEDDAPPAAAAEAANAEPAVALLLGSEPERLLAIWRAVAARTAGLAPSESLALAERELQSEARPEH